MIIIIAPTIIIFPPSIAGMISNCCDFWLLMINTIYNLLSLFLNLLLIATIATIHIINVLKTFLNNDPSYPGVHSL